MYVLHPITLDCMQTIEDRHLQAALAQDISSGSSSDELSNGSDAGSSDAELDATVGADLDPHVDDAVASAASQQHMNTSLLSMYATPAPAMSSGPSASDLVTQATPAASTSGLDGTAAFAPPHIVEAAARRALAAEKAQQTMLSARRVHSSPRVDDSLPSTSGELFLLPGQLFLRRHATAVLHGVLPLLLHTMRRSVKCSAF